MGREDEVMGTQRGNMEMGVSRLTGHAHHQLHLPPEGGQGSPKSGVPGADVRKKKGLLNHKQY